MTGELGGTSSEKSSKELGLVTIKPSRWLRKLCLSYKLIKEKPLTSFFQIVLENNTTYTTRSVQKS